LLNHFLEGVAICAALGESAAFQINRYLVTGQYDLSIRLGIIGILLILYSFPRQWEWLRTLSALDDDQA
jgi:hypothetical protein